MNVLIAGSALLESLSRARNAGPDTREALLLLCVAGVFGLLVFLLARLSGQPRGAAVEVRTDHLTQAVDLLELSEGDRRDLQRITKAAELKQPAAVLLSPMNLARAAAAAMNDEPDQELRGRLEQLCLRLFDEPLPDPGT